MQCRIFARLDLSAVHPHRLSAHHPCVTDDGPTPAAAAAAADDDDDAQTAGPPFHPPLPARATGARALYIPRAESFRIAMNHARIRTARVAAGLLRGSAEQRRCWWVETN